MSAHIYRLSTKEIEAKVSSFRSLLVRQATNNSQNNSSSPIKAETPATAAVTTSAEKDGSER